MNTIPGRETPAPENLWERLGRRLALIGVGVAALVGGLWSGARSAITDASIDVQWDADDQGFRVSLRNTEESPLRRDVVVRCWERDSGQTIREPELRQELEWQPGETIQLQLPAPRPRDPVRDSTYEIGCGVQS